MTPLIRQGQDLIATTEKSRLLALLGSAVGAVLLGFVLVTPAKAATLIVAGGYYFIFAVFAAFVFFAGRVLAARVEIWRGWVRRPGWVGLALLGATLFAVWSDSFNHKILFDEYVL